MAVPPEMRLNMLFTGLLQWFKKDFINLMEPEIKTYDWKVVP